MSSIFERHPGQTALLRYLEGELSESKASRTSRHLESCGPCRSELEELQEALADCQTYRAALRQEMPAPPREWNDLYREFSKIDESLANEPLLVRLVRPLTHAGAPRWAVAAVSAMLIVTGVYYQLRQAPSVHAATLLRKAVTAAQAKPPVAHRVRFRTAKQEFTRTFGPQAPVLPAAAAPVEALFASAHFNWNDPMSALSFEQWRDAQARKTDQVTEAAGNYQIKTTSEDGEIASATITLREADMAPMEERLEFRDHEWVEMTEIADPSLGNGETSVAVNNEVPVRTAEPPSRPAAFAPGPSASMSDEVQVLTALHGIGADLGDPVDASLVNGKIVVSVGEGTPADHLQRIKALESPIVEVRMETPQPTPEPPPPAMATGGGSAPVPAIQTRVEKQLGGRIQFERFTSQILKADDEAMAHVHALHNLVLKVSVEAESQLNAADREKLFKLSREHAGALSQRVNELKNLLLPTLTSLGGTPAQVRPAGHTAWQQAAEDVFASCRRVDLMTSVLVGATPSAGSTAGLPSELIAALKELDANLADFERLAR